MSGNQVWTGGRAPTLADFEGMAEESLSLIPERLRRYVDGVAIRVEDFPDAEVCTDMQLQTPFDLLGLYQGVSLTEKSAFDTPEAPDMIFLYRRPILDYWCETGEALDAIIRHVLIHEIGHHFGLSDDDMAAIERETDDTAAGLGSGT